ncbi:hypothetical protein ACRFK3_21255, partial [Escherichia coli]|uniref:hypothetical protein n=1 Tax=Escherichia coli TaxID=562 RepID=UPI003D6D0F7F
LSDIGCLEIQGASLSALANSTNLSDCCGILTVSKTQEDYDTWCHFLYDSHVITSGVPLWIITSL